MKTRACISLLTLLLFITACNAQGQIQIDTAEVSYYNGLIDKNEIIEDFRITNYSSEEYLTWVSLEPINERTNTELVHDYFKKRKGDFSSLKRCLKTYWMSNRQL